MMKADDDGSRAAEKTTEIITGGVWGGGRDERTPEWHEHKLMRTENLSREARNKIKNIKVEGGCR